jgi:hypothetical protein
MTRDQTLCFGKSPDSLTGRSTAARIASASLANAALGVNNIASPSGQDDRSGPRPGARPSGQARDQSGGPAAVQPGDRYRRRAAPLCPRGKDQRGQIGPISPPPARPSSCARRRPGRRKPKVPSRARRFCGSRGTQLFCFVVCITLICRIIFFKKPATFWNHALEIINRGLAVIPAKQDGYHSRSGGEFGPRINLS